MTESALAKQDVVRLLASWTDRAIADEVTERLGEDPRDAFPSSATRASALATSPETKLRIARGSERGIVGGDALLEGLRALGDAPVHVIGLDDPGVAFGVYLVPDTAIVGVLRFERPDGGCGRA